MGNESFRSILLSLHPSQLENYLHQQGWSRGHLVGRTLRQYRRLVAGQEHHHELNVPLDVEQAKYIDRLYVVFCNLGAIEDCEPRDLALAVRAVSITQDASQEPDLGIRSLLSETLAAVQWNLSADQIDQLWMNVEPAIARAQFVSLSLGSRGDSETLQMKAAMILVPLAKQLAKWEASGEHSSNQLASVALARITYRVMDKDQIPDDQFVQRCWQAMLEDDENAPLKSLNLLRQIRDA